MEASPFRDLIRRVRAGEEQAAVELLRRYEPAIRRTVRARLRHSQLRRLLDSMDLSQAVLGSFFVYVALGRYDLERPEDLLQLLTSMAHHKLTDEARRQRAGKNLEKFSPVSTAGIRRLSRMSTRNGTRPKAGRRAFLTLLLLKFATGKSCFAYRTFLSQNGNRSNANPLSEELSEISGQTGHKTAEVLVPGSRSVFPVPSSVQA